MDATSPWYTTVPIGRDTVADMTKKMSEEAELAMKYTNPHGNDRTSPFISIITVVVSESLVTTIHMSIYWQQ